MVKQRLFAVSSIVFIAAILFFLGVYSVHASDSSTVAFNTNARITAFSTCKKITNSSGTGLSVYVPTQSSAEWSSFYTHPPSGVAIGGCEPKIVFLTSGSTWTVPDDWNSADNSIEVIGGGGGGGSGATRGSKGGGGGGGAYSKVSNISLTPGGSVAYSVGAAGAGGSPDSKGKNGGSTWFCSNTTGCSSLNDTSV